MVGPRCFISYSWDSDEHKEWVRNLATGLMRNGVETFLDQWDLRPGMDLTNYVETCIRESDFVLLVCTPLFALKANAGRGGVGYEKCIVTGEIFQGVSSVAKFVPLLRRGTTAESLPSYLKSRVYVDFTIDASFADSIEQLLRHMFKSPKYVRPLVGPTPAFEHSAKPVERRSGSVFQEDYEIQTYTIALLGLISDVELTLTCYRDTMIEPDFSQMLNTIGGYGEFLLRMSQAKPAEQLGIAEEISELSKCITNLAKYPLTVGAPDRFGDGAKTCLSILMKIKLVLDKTAKVQSSRAYLLKLKKALGSLKRDWEIRARRFETRQVGLLKQAILQHAFSIYRFAAYPEAVELDLKDQLIALGQRLHELSSAEKYFPSYVRDGMLERIEGKYSECESLIDGIMKKAT